MKSVKLNVLLVILTLFAFTQTSLAENTVTKNYTVKLFNKLRVSSAFQVEFIHSDESKVVVEIDESAADNLFVGNVGNELVIKLKDNTNNSIHTMKAKVYGNSLSGISVSGASHFTSDYTFADKSISVRCTGASNIDVSVNTEDLDIQVSGASKATVKGSASKQTIQSSGASSYNSSECKSKDINTTASGASKAIINCSDILDATASGASHITYVNSPKTINKTESGASNIGEN